MLHLITEPVRSAEFEDWHKLGGPTEVSCIETLKRICAVMKSAAKCGLGQAAAEPLLSSMELFGHEYHALIAQRQEEFERLVRESSASSDQGEASDPVRSIMRRIKPY